MPHPPPPAPRRRLQSGLYNREQDGLALDVARVTALQLETSGGEENGPAWHAVRDDVWVYALPVLTSMLLKGTVWAQYRVLGGNPARDLNTPIGGIKSEEAHDIASTTLLNALPVLRLQLVNGRWDPTIPGAASVRTWAVNLCILRLPGPWRQWRRDRLVQLEVLPANLEDERPEQHPDAVLYRLEFERYVELLDDGLREPMLLDAEADTDVEIAQALGLTVKSVEYRLAKARQISRVRRDHEAARDFRDIGGGVA